MTVTHVTKDLDALTLTVTAEFDATVERIWRLWADPRQLERWWGPPEYPATVTEHDLRPAGRVRYHMTGPDGDQHHGIWRVLKVDAPHRLVLEDSFADAEGAVVADLPSSTTDVTIEAVPAGGTRMIVVSRFASAEALEQVLEMGAEEGFKAALGQIDDLLAEDD